MRIIPKDDAEDGTERDPLCILTRPYHKPTPAADGPSGTPSARPGLRHVGPLRVTVELDLDISGAAIVHYSGRADRGFVMHALTSEGIELIGLLPAETMAHLQDQIEAACQIDATALEAK